MKALKSILSSEYFQNPSKMFKFFLSEMTELRDFQTYLLPFAYLTIPLSVASGEWSFSRLKLIKKLSKINNDLG